MLIGVSKTGIPGLGILAVVLLLEVMPAKASVGFMLPLLIMGDIFAVSYYHRHAVWRHLLRLFPWGVVGVLIGYAALGRVTNQQLRPIIGGIVITLLALDFWRRRKGEAAVPTQWWFAAGIGVLAGVTTMLANAAGPLIIIYFLAMRLDKMEFIGTGAWYFFCLNCFKVPFFWDRGMITLDSLKADVMLLPAIAVGALAGIFVLKRIPQKWFAAVAKALAFAAAIRLLFS